FEERPRDAADATRQRVRLEPRDGAREHARGRLARRGRRVAARAERDEADRREALLRDADQRRVAVEARQHVMDQRRAFIERELRADTARREQLRDLAGAVLAADLLVVA